MRLLRLAVLGTPEVFHDGTRLTFALRKAQALLIYLAIEGGMHSRNKLTALLWPDSEPRDARQSLRNALTPLRSVLSDASASPHTHLISEGGLLGLNRQAPLELDLEVVQQVYQQALRLSTAPPQSQGAIPIENLQHSLTLVRGPSSTASGLERRRLLTNGSCNNNGNGTCACRCSMIGFPAGKKPPESWSRATRLSRPGWPSTRWRRRPLGGSCVCTWQRAMPRLPGRSIAPCAAG
jgi:hypothetical protein